MAGHVKEDCFVVKLSLILEIVNSTDRREEKRNFLIQGRHFRRSFKNYCNYRYFMKLSRLLSIGKLGTDVLLSEHLQSRCIDSSMYRYTPTFLQLLFICGTASWLCPTVTAEKLWHPALINHSHHWYNVLPLFTPSYIRQPFEPQKLAEKMALRLYMGHEYITWNFPLINKTIIILWFSQARKL